MDDLLIWMHAGAAFHAIHDNRTPRETISAEPSARSADDGARLRPCLNCTPYDSATSQSNASQANTEQATRKVSNTEPHLNATTRSFFAARDAVSGVFGRSIITQSLFNVGMLFEVAQPFSQHVQLDTVESLLLRG